MKEWLCCLALVAACKKKGGGGEAEYQRQMYKAMHDALVAPARRGPGFALAPQSPPPGAKATAPGPAYVLLREVGLATFGVDGKVTLQRLPLDRKAQLALAADGTPIVAAAHVMKVGNGGVEMVGGEDSPGVNPMGSPFEVAPDGSIWLADMSTIYGFDGTKWTKYDSTDSIKDFAFDGKGRVYTASAKQLGVIDGGAWKKMYDLEGTPHEGVVANPVFGSIGVVGKQLVATHSFGILKLDGTNVEAIARDVTAPQLLFGQFVGDEYVTLDKGGFVHTPIAGGADKVVPIKEAVAADHFALDGQGRAWLASGSSGLAVVDASGAVTSWPVGTLPELSSTIDALAIVGAGPDKLPGKTAVAKGTIKGRATKKGAPIAKAYVEICQAPLDHFPNDETPCGYASVHGKGDADENGVFSISGLPLQQYSIVIRDGDQWYSLLGTTCGGMHDGDTCDIGDLDVTNKVFPTTE